MSYKNPDPATPSVSSLMSLAYDQAVEFLEDFWFPDPETRHTATLKDVEDAMPSGLAILRAITSGMEVDSASIILHRIIERNPHGPA